MKTLILAIILSSSTAFAHSSHDWREDYLGYLSLEYKLPMKQGKSLKRFSQTPRLDMNFFKEKLSILTGVSAFEGKFIKNRKSSENLDITRAFLKREYAALGFEVSFQPFGGGTNFIAEKKGSVSPEKILILSSHIDSVNNPGANDDGTGTIGLLTVAKELASKNYGSTIRVLGFDKEETGLHGSDAYVATIADKKNIIGNINFEMMGHNSRKDGAFHVIDCDKENSLFLTDSIQSSINSLGLRLQIVETCTTRSDHASFWRAKIPAVVISENFFGGDGDPCYHAKCDVMDERLDYGYMANILESVLHTTESIAKNQQN